jgi:hypothetical protein
LSQKTPTKSRYPDPEAGSTNSAFRQMRTQRDNSWLCICDDQLGIWKGGLFVDAQVELYTRQGFHGLPICMAKVQKINYQIMGWKKS